MPSSPTRKCLVAAQAILAGPQDVRVVAFGWEQGWTTPYVSVRIGRVLLNIEDRDAFGALLEAVRQAEAAADQAFGPARRLPR